MWKYILIAIVVAALIGGAVAWRLDDIAHYKQVGRDELQAEIDLAKAKADEETRKKQSELTKKSRKVKDEIRKDVKKFGDVPVTPAMRRQLERMREDD